MTNSLMPVSSVLIASPLPPRTHSVGGVARLMQLEQKVVRDVKGGEADPHGNRPFNPVHAQAFV